MNKQPIKRPRGRPASVGPAHERRKRICFVLDWKSYCAYSLLTKQQHVSMSEDLRNEVHHKLKAVQ